jgi:hypothetical protein
MSHDNADELYKWTSQNEVRLVLINIKVELVEWMG